MSAMKHCRTPASPMMQVRCSECAHHKRVPHSCGHRHCPHCQHHESQQWLERQMKKQVPAEYFLLTFTVPAEFRPLAFAHPRVVYDLLIRCSWETLRTFSRNDKYLQGTPGATAVLHTHTRCLDCHPHVHVVMPAALDSEHLGGPETGAHPPVLPVTPCTGVDPEKIFPMRPQRRSGTGLVQQTVQIVARCAITI